MYDVSLYKYNPQHNVFERDSSTSKEFDTLAQAREALQFGVTHAAGSGYNGCAIYILSTNQFDEKVFVDPNFKKCFVY
jgi:hypothetical protein